MSKMKVVVLVTASLFCLISTSEAIRCLTCQNARTNEECQRTGRIVECPRNEDACQNEIRRDGRGLVISKRCKQSAACTNNYMQNPRSAWLPVQCNMRHESSVCRCCCYKNSCNFDTYQCPNDCAPQAVPSNGDRKCNFVNRYTEEQSQCTYTCKKGFTLYGHSDITCKREEGRSQFTHPAPACIQSSCTSEYKTIFNGKVSCSGGHLHGSICDFTCNYGFVLIGPSSSTCRQNNRWSVERPICRSIRCSPTAIDIENGSVRCSNYNVVGSFCKYTCKKGCRLVGQRWIKCKDDGDNDTTGKWANHPPKCVAEGSSCRAHVNPADGQMSCTSDNFPGSTCTFTCHPGYGLVGERHSSCVSDQLEADWSSAAPTCEPITCPPKMEEFEVGVTAACTAGNHLHSECTFTCNLGMRLVGEGVITCMDAGDDVGKWSDAIPTCELTVHCSPPLKVPANGNMTECSATEASNLYTGCLFQCDEGYQLAGSEQNYITCQCIDVDDCDAAQWSDVEPLCEPKVCPELGPLENGFISCSDEFSFTTVCTHTCNIGYQLNGQKETTCMVAELFRGDLTWSDDQPLCEAIRCIPQHIDFGSVDCTNANLHGSVCSFTCPNDERFLTGAATTTCTEAGNWDITETPTCELMDCVELPEVPERGLRVCSDGQKFGSVCEFTCFVHHEMDGSNISTCVKNSDGTFTFDSPPPECFITTCEEQGPLENGMYECSQENDVESICEYSCDEEQGWFVYPKRSKSNTCDLDASGSGYNWNIPMPCCAQHQMCPPFDIAIGLDSNAGEEDWSLQKDFVKSLISEFEVSAEFAQVSLFSYNKEIDFEISFKSFTSGIVADLTTLFPEPTVEGGAVNTGLALQHMHQSSFTEAAGDRPAVVNVALIITDGRVDDPELLLFNSENLRNDGVTIYAVGIGNDTSLAEVLDAITGDPAKTTMADNHLGLASILSSLSERICPNQCP